MINPLVSVVMAVRNAEQFLASAIESVQAQDYRPLEIVLVDGHSTDGTVEIARSYDGVSYVLQQGTGLAAAYNQGVESARGDLIAFLSYDDLWTPDKVSTQVTYLMEHAEVGYVVARVRFFLEPGSALPRGFRPELLEGDHPGRLMETLLAWRWVFKKVGPFDPAIPIANDVDWFARANDAGIPMAMIPRVLLHKRVHESNLSLSDRELRRDLLRAMRESVRRKHGPTADGDR